MGRITVFTADDVHSEAVLNLLESKSLPFVEINLMKHHSKVAQLLNHAPHCLHVPQVFFNSKWIGGFVELTQKLEKWSHDDSRRYSSLLECFENEVRSKPDPALPVFRTDHKPLTRQAQKTHEAESHLNALPSAPPPLILPLPDGTSTSIPDITERLRNSLPYADHGYKGKVYRHSFTGQTLLKSLGTSMDLDTASAIQFAETLLSQDIVLPLITSSSDDSPGSLVQKDDLYRLQCHAYPSILNSMCEWNRPVIQECGPILETLDAMVWQMEKDCLQPSSDKVDVSAVWKHDLYPQWEYRLCELQRVVFHSLGATEKVALGLNIYHLMWKYCSFKLGIILSEHEHGVVMKQVKFKIDGAVYSFQEWKDKMLRAYMKNDPRLHFAANVGAHMGCSVSPPFRLFQRKLLADQLDICAQVFLEDPTHIDVNRRANQIVISKVFAWNRHDFPRKETELLALMAKYVQGENLEKIEKAIKARLCPTYMDVDYDAYYANFAKFEAEAVKGDTKHFGRMSLRFQKPRMPDNERLRMETLQDMNILDTLPEERYDRITDMVREYFQVPIVLLSFVDAHRQWFKSAQWNCGGMPQPPEADRQTSFCGHAILMKDEDVMVVPDATQDDRFADNPFVAGPFGLRFYAGYVLSMKARSGDSVNVGTLCIMDMKPHHWKDEDVAKLREFGSEVMDELLRRKNAAKVIPARKLITKQ